MAHQSQPLFLYILLYHLFIIQKLNSQSFKCIIVTSMARKTDKKIQMTIKHWEMS